MREIPVEGDRRLDAATFDVFSVPDAEGRPAAALAVLVGWSEEFGSDAGSWREILNRRVVPLVRDLGVRHLFVGTTQSLVECRDLMTGTWRPVVWGWTPEDLVRRRRIAADGSALPFTSEGIPGPDDPFQAACSDLLVRRLSERLVAPGTRVLVRLPPPSEAPLDAAAVGRWLVASSPHAHVLSVIDDGRPDGAAHPPSRLTLLRAEEFVHRGRELPHGAFDHVVVDLDALGAFDAWAFPLARLDGTLTALTRSMAADLDPRAGWFMRCAHGPDARHAPHIDLSILWRIDDPTECPLRRPDDDEMDPTEPWTTAGFRLPVWQRCTGGSSPPPALLAEWLAVWRTTCALDLEQVAALECVVEPAQSAGYIPPETFAYVEKANLGDLAVNAFGSDAAFERAMAEANAFLFDEPCAHVRSGDEESMDADA